MMQDITPPGQNRRRSVRDITPTLRRKSEPRVKEEEKFDRESEKDSRIDQKEAIIEDHSISDPEHHSKWPSRSEQGHSLGIKKHHRRSLRWHWIGVVAVIIVLFFGSYLFSGAQISLTPKERTVSVDAEYLAVRDSNAGNGDHDLLFSTVTETRSLSREIEADEFEEVSNKATGRLTIYNEFSDASQVLVATTRFADPDGRIFRINEQVTVPGVRADGSAGTITVEVTADQPGEDYNIEPTTFTIPGFSGTPQFESFRGESGESFTGGGLGLRPVIDDETIDSIRLELEQELQGQMGQLIEHDLPTGYHFLPDSIFVDFANTVSVDPDNNSAEMTVTAQGFGLLISLDQLGRLLARDFIDGYDGEEISLIGVDQLNFETQTEDLSPATESVNILVSGSAHIKWEIDIEELKQALARERRFDVENVLSRFSGQFEDGTTVEVKMRPPWRLSMPQAENINIKLEQR